MSVSSFTLQLPEAPAGNTITLAVPTAGSWLGGIAVSIAVPAAATITLQTIKYIAGVPTYRTIWSNLAFSADQRRYTVLRLSETAIKVTYTCTKQISLCVETNTAYRPAA